MTPSKNTDLLSRCASTATPAVAPIGERDGRGRSSYVLATRPAEANQRTGVRRRLDVRAWVWWAGRFFPPNPIVDAVTTRADFDASPEVVWQRLMFYEEVPRRPPLLLRLFLPSPVRTQGGDRRIGAAVECTYTHGSLIKRYTVLDPPRLVRFEVIAQQLGVERCFTTVEGTYELRAANRGCSVALTTRYRGHLRPRWIWRPLERVLAHQLHRHILSGMGATS